MKKSIALKGRANSLRRKSKSDLYSGDQLRQIMDTESQETDIGGEAILRKLNDKGAKWWAEQIWALRSAGDDDLVLDIMNAMKVPEFQHLAPALKAAMRQGKKKKGYTWDYPGGDETWLDVSKEEMYERATRALEIARSNPNILSRKKKEIEFLEMWLEGDYIQLHYSDILHNIQMLEIYTETDEEGWSKHRDYKKSLHSKLSISIGGNKPMKRVVRIGRRFVKKSYSPELIKALKKVGTVVRNATTDDLRKALDAINTKYDGNVIFNREPEQVTKNSVRFTLRVKDSKGPGARRSHEGRPMTSACWHVHGDFFDALLNINPEAVIKTGRTTITNEGGNWEDFNIGSMMKPMYYSEACDCEK